MTDISTVWDPANSRGDWALALAAPVPVTIAPFQRFVAAEGAAGLIVSRATAALVLQASGAWASVAANVARLAYDPVTHALLGAEIETGSTNSIRNGDGVGAIAGTPGTLPTNWSDNFAGTGLTRQVVGSGTDADGLAYVDVRYSGTGTGSAGALKVELQNVIAAAQGQTWSGSVYVKLVGGSMANVVSPRFAVSEYNAVPAGLVDWTIAAVPTSTKTRLLNTATLSNGATAFVTAQFFFAGTNGAAVDFTVRISAAQLERAAAPSTYIQTQSAAANRATELPFIACSPGPTDLLLVTANGGTSWQTLTADGSGRLALPVTPLDYILRAETYPPGLTTAQRAQALSFHFYTGTAPALPPDLASGGDLVTAVLISLFTDRSATEDDIIPDGTTDRRGWLGDLGETVPIGSRLWLIGRAKQTNETLSRARGYIAEALQWMIDDGVAGSIDVYVEWTRAGMLGARITIYEPGKTAPTTVNFDWAWQGVS